jgi:hypothetical protein
VTEPKVVIAGTGRAGTTLLVQILTQLGLDTGFATDAALDTHARAGLELVTLVDAPRIVKNPALSTNLRGVLERGDVAIEHVIVPMRDLDIAAASRVRVSEYGRRPDAPGGMWHTNLGHNQRDALAGVFYELIWTLVEFDVPYTFLAFPRFALDADYLAEKLAWLAPDASVDDFRRAVEHCADPTLITQSALTDDERKRMRLGSAYSLFVAVPLKNARRLLYSARTRAGLLRHHRQHPSSGT